MKWGDQSASNNFIFTWNQYRPKANTITAQQNTINDRAVMAAAVTHDDTILILINHEMPP